MLFLACIGLNAGDRFVDTLLSGEGLQWVAYGLIITLLPLLLVAGMARAVWGLNFAPMTGMMAGATTDPPALAFANHQAGNEGPAVAYATVYPLTMILRVVSAQVFVLLFAVPRG